VPTINVDVENSGSVELYYEDHGSGRPVVLIHGWPLSGASWEKQLSVLLDAGHRVVTYDRRGFGRSSQPTTGYDYDTFTRDLRQIITRLKLRDVALVGFSMGGGEVARYLGTFGTAGVRKAAFIAAVPPYLLRAADNPGGVDGDVFAGIQSALVADRPAFLAGFLQNFYNVDVLGGTRISEQAIHASWSVAIAASPKATHACVATWGTDFRQDLARINIPTLVIHGDADRIVPIAASGKATHEAIAGSKLVVIEGGPHGVTWTHPDEVNAALVDFLR
jgi:non-heme chloroperoxidase